MDDADAVRRFWFDEAGSEKWFKVDPAFDAQVRDRFHELWAGAAAGDLASWEAVADDVLALVIVLDQFPRNTHRGSPDAFASDPQARAVAHRAIDAGHDRELTSRQRHFLYMPLMHSEELADQEHCVRCFDALQQEAPQMKEMLGYAQRHRDIVARFGRFPHRNKVLGRECTAEEMEFLTQPGSSFG